MPQPYPGVKAQDLTTTVGRQRHSAECEVRLVCRASFRSQDYISKTEGKTDRQTNRQTDKMWCTANKTKENSPEMRN